MSSFGEIPGARLVIGELVSLGIANKTQIWWINEKNDIMTPRSCSKKVVPALRGIETKQPLLSRAQVSLSSKKVVPALRGIETL